MVLPVSEVFSRHVSETVKPAFLLEKFAEDLGDLVDDLNAALLAVGGTRDVFLNNFSGTVDICLREYPRPLCLSPLEGELRHDGAGVPEIIVGAALSFDPDAVKFNLHIDRDPEGHYDEDKTETLTYPVSDEGLQKLSVVMASLLNEYLDLPEKMAYFRVISQKNAQAVLSL